MSPRRGLALALFAVAVLATWLVQARAPRGTEVTHTSAHESSAGATPAELEAGQSTSARREASPERDSGTPGSQLTSVRAFLADYWGERWPELEPKMVKSGLDLEQLFEPVPWETAAASIESKIPLTPKERKGATTGLFQWAESSEPEPFEKWLRREFSIPRSRSLDESDLLDVQDLARPYNDDIAVLAEEWADKIDLYSFERWSTGNFVKAPFATIGVSQEMGFSSKSIADSGWSIVITLKREDYPDMAWIEKRAAELREQRDQAITAYLLGQAGR